MTSLPEMRWKPLVDGHEPKAIDQNSMLSRVARAIEESQGSYEDQARAAIEAMRIPTPEMTAVMKDYVGRVDEVSATWLGMIEAALDHDRRR